MSATGSFHIDEHIVVEDDDWINALQGEFRAHFLETLRNLSVKRIQRFPPPKTGSVPLGHEFRVFSRFCRGKNVIFDPSGFARLYFTTASRSDQNVYRAFIAGEPLPAATWSDLIGKDQLDAWIENKLFRESEEGLRSRFHVFPIDGLTLIGDTEKPVLLRRVLIGQDSFNMVDFLNNENLGRFHRYLDVGPGSGVILLAASQHCDESVGLDINPRAVTISRLNAELNQKDTCTIHYDNAIESVGKYGTFDLVTWNSPFVFLPEECKDTHYDGYGGYMGMEIVVAFLKVLPKLLTEGGKAYVTASSPILKTGENLLEAELRKLLPELGLDVNIHVLRAYWHTLYRDFHEAHGIRKFELVYLELSRGRGDVRTVRPAIRTRLADSAREVAYRIWK